MTNDEGRWSVEIFDQAQIQVRQEGPILTVTLDRPAARNAQTPATWRALAHVGDLLKTDADGIALVVIRGNGQSFSAGLDRRMFTPEGVPGEVSLAGLIELPDGELDGAIAEFQRGFTWQREVRPLTVAAVQGHAIGAGFQLALACDIIIATSDASFAMRETSLGLVPDLGGTHPLVRTVGLARAVDMCATGRAVSAQEAVECGLVARVVKDLGGALEEYAAAVTSAPPGAVGDLLPLLTSALLQDPVSQRASERRAQIARLRALTSRQA